MVSILFPLPLRMASCSNNPLCNILAVQEELQEKIHYLNKDLLKSKETVSQLEDKLAQKEPVSPQRWVEEVGQDGE